MNYRILPSSLAVAALGLGLALAGPAAAEQPQGRPVEVDMTDIFKTFCVDVFPDAAAIEGLATARGATPLAADDLRRYLNVAQGQGWHLKTSQGLYAVIVERAPSPSCGIRRMTPEGLGSAAPYLTVVWNYTDKVGGRLKPMPPFEEKSPEGAELSAVVQEVVHPDGQHREKFMLVSIDHHGKVGDPWRADAGSGSGIEVRMHRALVQ